MVGSGRFVALRCGPRVMANPIQIFDEAITSKWRKEALAMEEMDISERMMDWCFDELRYKATLYEATGAVSIYTGDVVKSDRAIPGSLTTQLKAAVKPLEDVPPKRLDWHPGSDEKVLELVHPSLFPLVYGVSRILSENFVNTDDCVERCGEGITIPIPPTISRDSSSASPLHQGKPPAYSHKFQWLPCDVDISGDSTRYEIQPTSEHPNPLIAKQYFKLHQQPTPPETPRPLHYHRANYQPYDPSLEYDPYASQIPRSAFSTNSISQPVRSLLRL